MFLRNAVIEVPELSVRPFADNLQTVACMLVFVCLGIIVILLNTFPSHCFLAYFQK
jgi:hypothetical protein